MVSLGQTPRSRPGRRPVRGWSRSADQSAGIGGSMTQKRSDLEESGAKTAGQEWVTALRRRVWRTGQQTRSRGPKVMQDTKDIVTSPTSPETLEGDGESRQGSRSPERQTD
ncbi:hypothetical protein NDU88_007392 [Pleurodeles waltl]|uniref:Uncharacterized protein n=1 Tax=Pleurodeles waltl TaxID=8319 RepID=A0AAV7QPN1_PLEWA|nr:hypothetical protein NDU88_007392 [Pleurodeles waltl]